MDLYLKVRLVRSGGMSGPEVEKFLSPQPTFPHSADDRDGHGPQIAENAAREALHPQCS